eukprot:501606-Rhodomonas_salina.2
MQLRLPARDSGSNLYPLVVWKGNYEGRVATLRLPQYKIACEPLHSPPLKLTCIPSALAKRGHSGPNRGAFSDVATPRLVHSRQPTVRLKTLLPCVRKAECICLRKPDAKSLKKRHDLAIYS